MQSRTIGRIGTFGGRAWRAIMIDGGSAEAFFGEGRLSLKGPCLAWMPWGPDTVVRVAAGSVGKHVLLGEAPVANAIGHKPESSDLRILADRACSIELDELPEVRSDLRKCFDTILRETASGQPAHETMVEAQVRTLLILLWRQQGQTEVFPAAPVQAQRILQSFRNLLEIHFRDRWHIRRYADEIGISSDRLHDICRRNIGKPPRQLVHERLAYEARMLLERSSHTVDQIGGLLGFGDAAQFSRFFKIQTGMPPGRYRRTAQQVLNDPDESTAMTYADWP